MKSIFFLSLLILCLNACQNQAPNLGIAQNHLPAPNLLQKGVVNKYYTHWLQAGKKDIITDIEYRSFQLSLPNRIKSNVYDAAITKEMSKEFTIVDNQVLLKKEERYSRKDTAKVTIFQPITEDWKHQICESKKTIHYSWGTRTWNSQQEKIRDSILMNKPAKILEGTQSYLTIWKTDTTTVTQKYKNIYVKDLGLYAQTIESEVGKFWKELVEQIPLEKFEQMVNHGRHRVAYIDPEKAMDKGANFELCKKPDYIFDYYNSRGSDYLYKGGKRIVWQILEKQLDPSKLSNESGYLTFRFIVNCKGEAGRFITEQADLDFQQKTFNPIAVEHCYQIIKSMEDWIPMKQNKQPVDAYYYLTFKMKNGEVIEILPL